MMDKYDLFFEVIKHYEGFSPTAYMDSVNVKTIGYGRTHGDLNTPTTKLKEKQWVLNYAKNLNKEINFLIVPKMNQYQMAALMSFTYNLGTGSLRRSTMARLLNEGSIFLAADEFPKWCKAGGRVLPGLVKRRMTEYALFKQSRLLMF